MLKHWKVISGVSMIAVVILVALSIWVIMAVQNWFRVNEFVFHMPVEVYFFQPVKIARVDPKIISPVVGGMAYAAEKPKLSKEEYIKTKAHAKQIMYIWEHETSKGKRSNDPTALNEKCIQKGQTNEFGYSPFDVTCFSTFEESVDAVENWLAEADERALCRYNNGNYEKGCDYVARWNPNK